MTDEKKIINLLKENSRYTNEYIAKELGVSEGTVRNKIKKLLDDEKIIRFTIKTRNEISSICMIETSANIKTIEIIKKMKKIVGVDEIFEVSGDYTIICKIVEENLSKTNDIIEKVRQIKGVINTKTYTVLNEM